ncbi:MAG TPA: DinB family protein [Candidatus Limnocylindrales bacterium]|nr:DinB family protein [Candidatus Limnocylindrales bacterium]
MKHLRIFCLLLVLSFAISAMAQGKPAGPAASPAPQAQTAPEPPASIASVVDRQVSQYEKNVVDAAEAMPEDKYNFTPASLNIPGSAYGNVRTFAELVKHTATANYRFWSILTGEKVPENIKGSNGPEELKSKAQIVRFLKDSFAVGHRAAKSLTSENALQEVQFFRGMSPRLYVATAVVIHAADEYGQMVEYLRMNGIVPPASRGR